jgi:hypothetical protein
MNLQDPNEADLQRLGEQLAVAQALATKQGAGAVLNGSRRDLDVIQSILDAGILGPEDTYELQSLGVAFGSSLIEAFPGLDWAIIDDEYGRDPTIRYTATSVAINVLTMISKRVEDGEHVDVHVLFNSVLNDLPRIIERSTGRAV